MKCKRIIKVVGALALTLALLVSSSVVSFAAGSYTTTTKYIDKDTIEVTSVAYDLESGDKATYVAYNNGSFSEANAVYIDQATADGTNPVTFNYRTSSDNVNATVKFGGSTEGSAQDVDETLGYFIDVYVGDVCQSNQVVAEVDASYPEDYLAREFDVTIDSGKVVESVAFNGAPVDVWYVKNGKVVVMSNVIKDHGTLTITTKTVENVELKLGEVTGTEGSITAFAQFIGDATDYGILVGGEATTVEGAASWDADTINYSTQTVKLPALGQSTSGVFCVELQDEALGAGTYKVAAYAGSEVTTAKSVTIE